LNSSSITFQRFDIFGAALATFATGLITGD